MGLRELRERRTTLHLENVFIARIAPRVTAKRAMAKAPSRSTDNQAQGFHPGHLQISLDSVGLASARWRSVSNRNARRERNQHASPAATVRARETGSGSVYRGFL